MGKIYTANSGLADALFSAVQKRVLGVIFTNPDAAFSTSDVIRHVGSGTGAVHRELRRLASAGIVLSDTVGNQKRYRANRASPIFTELYGLLVKTIGLVGPLGEALNPLASAIDVAFVYGSAAKGTDTSTSDIDLMILSDRLAYSEIFAATENADRALGRKVNPSLMTLSEWQRKLADGTSFVRRVSEQPKLFVFGSEDDLRGVR